MANKKNSVSVSLFRCGTNSLKNMFSPCLCFRVRGGGECGRHAVSALIPSDHRWYFFRPDGKRGHKKASVYIEMFSFGIPIDCPFHVLTSSCNPRFLVRFGGKNGFAHVLLCCCFFLNVHSSGKRENAIPLPSVAAPIPNASRPGSSPTRRAPRASSPSRPDPCHPTAPIHTDGLFESHRTFRCRNSPLTVSLRLDLFFVCPLRSCLLRIGGP